MKKNDLKTLGTLIRKLEAQGFVLEAMRDGMELLGCVRLDFVLRRSVAFYAGCLQTGRWRTMIHAIIPSGNGAKVSFIATRVQPAAGPESTQNQHKK